MAAGVACVAGAPARGAVEAVLREHGGSRAAVLTQSALQVLAGF
ncbi:hypothetical protein [Dactylosporangium sp. CA-139066]